MSIVVTAHTINNNHQQLQQSPGDRLVTQSAAIGILMLPRGPTDGPIHAGFAVSA